MSKSPSSIVAGVKAESAAAEQAKKHLPISKTKFLGAQSDYTEEISFAKQYEPVKCFRRMDTLGRIIDPAYKPTVDDATLVKMYRTMVQLNTMDEIFYESQRQGRISFYMTNYGEEATHIGSCAALEDKDVIFGQYREAGVLMWRGFTLDQFANQCFSNQLDLGKGRQMPVHYGSRALNFQTISSPLATQIPQAAGAAYALKRDGNGAVVMCYFGDGAASEGDFHVAMNMSATLKCPVIFFCRNNGYAISTPTHEQYRGDGIVGRASGYGMQHIRVDGNDLLAVFDATTEARRLAVTNNEPVMIEAMTYRGGHHSTSDDSSRYRQQSEIDAWKENDNPLTRLRLLLESKGEWDSAKELEARTTSKKDVMRALAAAGTQKRPPVSELFTDVYDTIPKHLLEQQKELADHLAKYGDHYQLSDFQPDAEYKNPAKL